MFILIVITVTASFLVFIKLISPILRKRHDESLVISSSKKITVPQDPIDERIRINSARDLATAIVNTVLSQKRNKKGRILLSSDICCADTVFFSFYVMSSICSIESSSGYAEYQFTDYFKRYIVQITKDMFLNEENVLEMLLERIMPYEMIAIKNGNIYDSFDKILDQFELIIHHDLIEKEYEPLNSTSPIPLIDFFDSVECRKEITEFVEALFKNTKTSIEFSIKFVL